MNRRTPPALFALALLAAAACSSGPEPAPSVNVKPTLGARSYGGRGLDSLPGHTGAPQNSARAAAMQGAAGGIPGQVGGATQRRRITTNPQPDWGLALPHWVGSFKTQGTTFNYAVVGADPALGQTTIIPTVVIPYRLVFADGTVLDASSDIIDGTTALQGVMSSPIFNNAPFSAGGTSLGVTQWGDAVLRAEFWNRRPASDGYHVLLSPTVLPTVTLNVPADKGSTYVDTGSGRRDGTIDTAWANSAIASVMASEGVTPDKLAVNLFTEAELYTLSNSGSAGYHGAVDLSAATGVAGLTTFIQTGYFGSTSQHAKGRPNFPGTGILGHETAEWIMDPAVANVVPGWQFPNAPGWCFSPILEVGDPVEEQQVALQVPVGGTQYVLPDVALLPYFSRTQNTPSVNGWDTLMNTYTAPSTPCSYLEYWAAGVAFSDDTTGQPITTVLSGVNNTQGAAIYYVVNGFPVAFQVSGFDLVHLNFGTVSLVSVPRSSQPGDVYATIPTGISDAGSIVGYFFDDGGTPHGFLEQAGKYTTIDVPGAVATLVLGLNNRGSMDLVGQFFDAQGVGHGFVRRNGQFFKIDAPSAVNTSINGINDLSQLVGSYDTGGPQSGFDATLGDSGVLTGFVTVNGPSAFYSGHASASTQLTGISNSGEVIGTQTIVESTGYSYTVALELVNGAFQILYNGHDGDAAFQLIPSAINSSGIVVGQFTDLYGTFGAFWVPLNLFSGGKSAQAVSTMALPANLPVIAGAAGR
jgi:hypothetical protein